jgi:hypothetical protein
VRVAIVFTEVIAVVRIVQLASSPTKAVALIVAAILGTPFTPAEAGPVDISTSTTVMSAAIVNTITVRLTDAATDSTVFCPIIFSFSM